MSDVASGFVSAAIVLAETLVFMLLWSGVLQWKRNKYWVYFLLVASIIAVSFFINMFVLNDLMVFLLFSGLFFVIARAFYSNPWYVLLFCCLLGNVYLKAVDNAILYLASLILKVTPQVAFEGVYSFFFFVLLSKLVEFIGAWCFAKISKQWWGKEPTHWQSWLQTLPLPLTTCLFLTISFQLSFTQPQIASFLLLFSSILLCLCMVQFFIASRLDKQRQSETENQRLQQTLALRKDSLQSLTEAYTLQRRSAHEFNNRLVIIGELAQQEKLQELKQYLGELHQTLQGETIVIHTDNAVMDAVLNQKYRMAAQHGIAIDFNLMKLAGLPLRSDEFAVVVSNLLDNAIEACAQYTEKCVIRLKIKAHEGQLLLMVTNPAKVAPQRIEGRWITTKSNAALHGFGLSNVESILDSFDAEYASEYANGIFSYVAFIPLPNPDFGK